MASEPDRHGRRGIAGAARAHDPDAWESIYRESHPRLLGYARRRLRSDGEAEDAVSETMMRAIEGIGGFRPTGASLEAWLFGILRLVVLEDRRRSTRRAAMEDPTAPEPADAAADPARAAQAAETRRGLRAAFGDLSEADREILELRVVAGLSAEDVATVVGRRPGAVRMAQARALERLRGRIEERDRAR